MTTPHLTSHLGASLKTILIIDDDTTLSSTLALGLEANGYRALCAADAAIGWKLAHAHLPDLILSDIEMPGKDGRRLLQDMRQGRAPGFRGLGGRMARAAQAAQQFANANQ